MKAQDKRQKRRTAADRQAKAQARLLGGKSPAIQPGMQGGAIPTAHGQRSQKNS